MTDMTAEADAAVREVDPKPVEEVLRAFSAALRSYRLYEGSNPMVDRFVATFREKLSAIWAEQSALRLTIEEERILWEGQPVFPSAESGPEMAFLFYRDGVREITLLPGFGDEEVLSVLKVLSVAPNLRREEDDLVTLLWQEDLEYFRYRTVEAADEVGEIYEKSDDSEPQPVDTTAVREDEPERPGISTDEFQETLYFLDESELRRLREEIDREASRDLWQDVLNALLDRLEDGADDRQKRIIVILGELLPSALGSAQFDRSADLLEELVKLAGQQGVMDPAALREVRDLFEVLGRDETIFQLADILEEMPQRLSEDSVVRLLTYFPPGSIASLLRAVERVEQTSVKRAFEACIQRLAESHRGEIANLLDSDDPTVLMGALRWVGRLEIGSALDRITGFLDHPDAEVRIAAIDALVSIRAAAAAASAVPLLSDPVRDVRISAARGLSALGYAGARSALEEALGSKRLKEADRLEKMAFFEAYGRLAGQDGVSTLDRILNSRGWLNRGESAETRACAALGLARIRHPSATAALEKAEDDSDAVVRAAVGRALRGEVR